LQLRCSQPQRLRRIDAERISGPLLSFANEAPSEISFGGIFVYPRRTAPFGFNGGFYYTRLLYEF